MTEDLRKWLNDILDGFVQESTENSLKMDPDERAFDEILVGFSSGADPLYNDYKELIGLFHWTPLEILSLTFPELATKADQLTVISWILPHREPTKADNRKESFYPSRRWVHARFPGEEFNNLLRKHLVERLAEIGVQAVAPVLSPQWSMEKSPKYGFAS
ncbi:MAG: epoxyqueuosine reductase, partial [Desulfomonilaceae bacterium]